MSQTLNRLAITFCCSTLIFAIWLHAEEETVSEKIAVMDQILHHEGPHLIYQQDHATLISAKPQDGKMQLQITNAKTPRSVTVFKSGEMPLSFEVPLKTTITTPPISYDKAEKIFAISDVEGNFNTVTRLLSRHQVIDNQLNWQYGKGHLVIIGDVFDRGNFVTELLWLIYRLEDQAKAQGGQVHMILGNHEIMNLQNDLRYVEPKYTAFEQQLSEKTGLKYVDLFGQNSELGRWLRSKNFVEKIGDILFTHGGLSPVMLNHKYSLADINQSMRDAMDTPKSQRNDKQSRLFGRNGPIWYRGYFMSLPTSPMINENDLSQVLNYYQAKSIAVGHNIVEKPQQLFNRKVIAVNVKHPADHLDTKPPRISYGVLFKDNKIYAVDWDGGVVEI